MRILLGMLVVTLVATAGFAVAINYFVEILERELVVQTMTREMDGLAQDYRAFGHNAQLLSGKRGESGRVFVVDNDATRAALPSVLAAVGPSQHHLKIHLGKRAYYAGWRAVDGASLYLLIDVDPIDRLERRLAVIGWTTLAIVLLVAILVSLGCAFLILRPVRTLARRLSEVEPQHPSAPIGSDYRDRDMREIASSFDALVGRFQRFAERERAFTADAGHELRTPLSVVLSTHELLLTMDELPAKARQRALRSQAACQRMNRTVTALLFLARDEIITQACSQPRALAQELAEEYAHLLDTHHNQLVLDIADVTLPAPPEALTTLLHNLVGHAVSHSEHTTIRLVVTADSIRLDYGSLGRLPTHLDNVFQREYQPERGGRFGLGLYLVGRLCARLGWSVRGDTATDGSASIHINCPPNHSRGKP